MERPEVWSAASPVSSLREHLLPEGCAGAAGPGRQEALAVGNARAWGSKMPRSEWEQTHALDLSVAEQVMQVNCSKSVLSCLS